MLQGIITAILLLAFLGGVVWLFVLRKRSDFDAAAHLPLESDGTPRQEETP